MITSKQLEELGFSVSSDRKSVYDGQLMDFYKKVDNGHIMQNHDITEVYVTKEINSFTIEIDHHSSYDYLGKRVVFIGKCETIEFLEQVLNSVLMMF